MSRAAYFDAIPLGVLAGIDRIPRASAQQKLAKTAERTKEGTTRNKFCEVCGRESELGFLIGHHIIPEHVTRQLSIADSKTIGMCLNCHSAVHNWYAMKAFSAPYDHVNKRFKPKLPSEIVREYETAYISFIQHQKQR